MTKIEKIIPCLVLIFVLISSAFISILPNSALGDTYSKKQIMSQLKEAEQAISQECNSGGDQYSVRECQIVQHILQIDETGIESGCLTPDQILQIQSLFSQLYSTLQTQQNYLNSLGANIPTGALNQYAQVIQQLSNDLTANYACSGSSSFTVSPNTNAITLVAGGSSKQFSVAVNIYQSEYVQVQFQSANPIHDYIHINCNPLSGSSSFTSQCSISIKSGAPSGTYPLYVVASGGLQVKKSTINLTIVSEASGTPKISYHWSYKGNTITVKVTNNGNSDAKNIRIWVAWDASRDAGYNRVWSQYTSSPFSLSANYLQGWTFHLTSPPTGKQYRFLIDVYAENVNHIKDYGSWSTMQ